MSCITSISDLYISKISLILLMFVFCAAYVRSNIEVQKNSPHSYIRTQPSRSFYLFSDVLKIFSSPLISYAPEVYLYLSTHVVVLLLISNFSFCIDLLTCTIVSLAPNFFSCVNCASFFSIA